NSASLSFPPRRSSDLRVETYFFMKFTVERLLRGFIGIDAALRELPGILPAHAPRPEQLAPVVGKHDAHIGAKSIIVYHGSEYPRSEEHTSELQSRENL